MIETRPWGSYETICEGDGYLVKIIRVKPHKRLSLQKHMHRSETWTVLSGSGMGLLGNCWHVLEKNGGLVVPVTVQHRLDNDSDEELVILEVQVGQPDEADIIRLEDDFGRI